MDIREYNREAWNGEVRRGNIWTVPVTSDDVERARRDDWSVLLTPTKPVPRNWFGEIKGKSVLCLASGGGQQGPILAAAGARVTVFDNSPLQLETDAKVAKRDGLELRLLEGDMRDLSGFAPDEFDLIFHPCSNMFIDDVRCVWREAFRVLKPGCALLSGVTNPLIYIFDWRELEKGKFVVRHSIPYSDLQSLPEAERKELILDKNEPLEFGHSLDDLLGGQLAAGFVIADLFEDHYGGDDPLSRFISAFLATRALKL